MPGRRSENSKIRAGRHPKRENGSQNEPKGAKKEPKLIKTSYTRKSSEIVKNGKMNKLTSVKNGRRTYLHNCRESTNG